MRSSRNTRRAFTLVELMVVIVIIGLLAALAIPRMIGATNKSKAAEFKPILKQIYTLQMAYKQEKEAYSTDATGEEIGFTTPSGNSARFTYVVTVPAADAAGVANAVATASPNSLGQRIKYNGTDNLVAADHGCVDPVGQLFADDNLATISGTDAGNCP